MKKLITGALLAGAVMSMQTPLVDKPTEGIDQKTGGTGFIDCLKGIFCGKKTTPENQSSED